VSFIHLDHFSDIDRYLIDVVVMPVAPPGDHRQHDDGNESSRPDWNLPGRLPDAVWWPV